MPTLDFAAAWAEANSDPLIVVVDALDLPHGRFRRALRRVLRRPVVGERVVLPGTMPAGLRLHMWEARQHGDPDRDLTYGELKAAGEFLFGAKPFGRLLRARMTEEHLTEAVMTILALYAAEERRHLEADESPPSGGSEVPGTSSATSGPSQPTSPVSTASTSTVAPSLSVG